MVPKPQTRTGVSQTESSLSDGVSASRYTYLFLQRLIPVVVLAGWLLPNEVRNRHRTKSGAHDHPPIDPSPGLSPEPPPGSALDEDEEELPEEELDELDHQSSSSIHLPKTVNLFERICFQGHSWLQRLS